MYDVSDGTPVLRRPEESTDLPQDIADVTAVARAQIAAGTEVLRTEHLTGQGEYRLRACEVEPGVVLVSGAPLDDIENTVRRLVTVQVVTFGLALLALVVFGRRTLRRGLKPLSDMAHTAHGIASHDLTESAARLPVRADGRDGGPEVAELRTAFNTMLDHIDDALAVRAEAEQRLRRFVADASHELRTPLMSVRGYADLFQYAAANAPGERTGTWPGCAPRPPGWAFCWTTCCCSRAWTRRRWTRRCGRRTRIWWSWPRRRPPPSGPATRSAR